jgi:hypothetical protein
MVTPVAINSIGWQYYIVYGAIAACIPISVYFFFPETMGRSLEDIELLFKESPSVWATVRYAKSRPVRTAQEMIAEKGAQTDHSE